VMYLKNKKKLLNEPKILLKIKLCYLVFKHNLRWTKKGDSLR
jgi:hypothetical protein